jgi:hypothetical protein
MRALIQRIKRKLATERGYVLKIMRGNRWRGKLGDYYAVDPKRICDGPFTRVPDRVRAAVARRHILDLAATYQRAAGSNATGKLCSDTGILLSNDLRQRRRGAVIMHCKHARQSAW